MCHKPAYRNPAGVRRIVRGKAAIETSVEADYPKLDALYKEIHALRKSPFQQVKTASKLTTEMRAVGGGGNGTECQI